MLLPELRAGIVAKPIRRTIFVWYDTGGSFTGFRAGQRYRTTCHGPPWKVELYSPVATTTR